MTRCHDRGRLAKMLMADSQAETTSSSNPAFDAIVVGGGPSGLSAATWLARYRRRTLLVDAGEHRNKHVDAAHGYLTRDGAAPQEILDAARRDLAAYDGARCVDGDVAAIEGSLGNFDVQLVDGRVYRALRIVLCTGVKDVFPDVEGFTNHYGASVFHCAACDGYESRDRDVVVLGWGDHVPGFALELLDWARSITIVTEGHRLEAESQDRRVLADHGVVIVEQNAVRLRGARGALEAVTLGDGTSVPCQMVFFSIDHEPRRALADALGCDHESKGCVVVDEHGETSVPGVYAAGDLVPGYQLIQVAAAKGTTAGVGCARSLRREPPLEGRPTRAPVVEEVLGI
jgi:thioredoxin reductase